MTTALAERTLGDALDAHFARSGFGRQDYTARWAVAPLGPITLVSPNWPARARALSLHDLHHALTGYDTSLVGEAELGAYEVASGCGRHGVSWFLEHEVFSFGLLFAPRRVARAFLRGRRAGNLYDRREADDALLARPLEEVERELGLDELRPVEARDLVALAGWTATALLRLPVQLALYATLYPVVWALFQMWWRWGRAVPSPRS